MARLTLDTRDAERVRRLRRLVRRWFGPDAEMVFGEAADNVLDHTEHKRAVVSFHARGFRISNFDSPFQAEGLTKFITNAHRQSGYGLLIIAALGGDLNFSEEGTSIDWHREKILSPR